VPSVNRSTASSSLLR